MRGVFRSVMLLAPAIMLCWCFLSIRYETRARAGAFLAVLWHGLIGLMLAAYGAGHGWWRFAPSKVALYGVPLDLIMAQAMAAGCVAFWLHGRMRMAFLLPGFGLYIAGMFSPFTHPGEYWATGVSAAVLLVMAPAFLLAYWTRTDTRLYPRAALQPFLWAGVLLWFIPVMVLEATGGGWGVFLDRPPGKQILYGLPLLLPGYLLLSALYGFARDGGGTGFPYDPPKRLVTSGVYARVSNPMQLGVCLLMAWWGVMVACVYVSLTAVAALLLFIVFKNICNGSSRLGETDPHWAVYQRTTPKWAPWL